MKFNVDRLSKNIYFLYERESQRGSGYEKRGGRMGGILITTFILWLATRDE